MKTTAVALARAVTKEYFTGREPVPVLRGIDLRVGQGDFIAVMGASGSGKSTLLHILGCLDRPSSGTYQLAGMPVADLSDRKLSCLRNRYIGFIFQEFNLLPQATVFDNIALPFLYSSPCREEARTRVLAAVEEVGLAHRLDHFPAELSGGERQRVAIARAVVTGPRLLLADEPTGNLDSVTSGEIMDLFARLHRQGATIVLATHDREVAAQCTSLFIMKDGRLTRQR